MKRFISFKKKQSKNIKFTYKRKKKSKSRDFKFFFRASTYSPALKQFSSDEFLQLVSTKIDDDTVVVVFTENDVNLKLLFFSSSIKRLSSFILVLH